MNSQETNHQIYGTGEVKFSSLLSLEQDLTNLRSLLEEAKQVSLFYKRIISFRQAFISVLNECLPKPLIKNIRNILCSKNDEIGDLTKEYEYEDEDEDEDEDELKTQDEAKREDDLDNEKAIDENKYIDVWSGTSPNELLTFFSRISSRYEQIEVVLKNYINKGNPSENKIISEYLDKLRGAKNVAEKI
jgi:hypothetical protein